MGTGDSKHWLQPLNHLVHQLPRTGRHTSFTVAFQCPAEPGKSFTHKLSSSYCTCIPTSVGSHTGKICGTDTATWLNELLWFVPDHCHQQLNLVSLHLQVISILEDYAYAFNSNFKSTVCIDYNNLLQIFITTTANELSWLTGKD